MDMRRETYKERQNADLMEFETNNKKHYRSKSSDKGLLNRQIRKLTEHFIIQNEKDIDNKGTQDSNDYYLVSDFQQSKRGCRQKKSRSPDMQTARFANKRPSMIREQSKK